jgi:hypothetical protein
MVYRQAIADAITIDQWREIVSKACDEALEGDQRARDWVLKLLGVVVRTEDGRNDALDKVTHGDLLGFVAASRTTIPGEPRRQGLVEEKTTVESEGEMASHRGAPTPSWLGAGYRQAILDVVTPEKWRQVVANARSAALAGDHRARDWVLKLLGIDDRLIVDSVIDDDPSDVTLKSLVGKKQ